MKKFFFVTFVVTLVLSLFGTTANAQQKESPWQEAQTVVIPAGQQVYEGVTRNGNAKFWFEFPQIGKVTVSPASAQGYKDGTKVLVLVKWTHKDDPNKVKYSVRQKDSQRGSSKPNVDIKGLF